MTDPDPHDPIQPSPAQLILAEIHRIRGLLDDIERHARRLVDPGEADE